MSYLTLTHLSDNLGSDNGPYFMTIRVADEAGRLVSLDFHFDEAGDSIHVFGRAEALTGIYNGSHLIGLVSCFLWDQFGGDHTFLSDVFLNESFDDYIELQMPVELPNYAGV